MEMDVEKISADIVGAVNIIMNPLTPSAERRRAHEMLDTFKDTSPLCAECGFYLSAKDNSPTIRHCGFQLIDNYIKVHWNEIDVPQKLWIKDSILNCIASGTNPVLSEEIYIKDAVSRIVVELIKREWPQNWPSLMEELHNLCVMGDTQAELVLLIFSRLADDIVQFQNVPDMRRRDIYKTLCIHLPNLFSFFWKTLSHKTDCIENVKHSTELEMQNSRLIHVTLDTLSTFVEWVPMTYIAEIPLFKLLSKLLELENLRLSATSCLLSIFERKGKPEERKGVLMFFEEADIFKEISGLDEATLLSEKHYFFLRELSKCFLSLGTNLCAMMTQVPCNVPVPQSLPLFLDCALIFAKHPSLVISQYAQSLWLNIFRNPVLSKSTEVLNLIPALLKCQVGKLIKVGYPSKSNSISCRYSLTEFDSDEDFERSFNRCRAEVGEVLRLLMNIQPQVVFAFGKTLLTLLCEGNSWHDLGIVPSDVDLALCWDAMAVYIEAVGSNLTKKDVTITKEYAEDAFVMITMCKNLGTKDPVLLSYSLSCISSLFYFHTFAPENVSDVLNKIFSYFTEFPKEGPMDREVMNLRRHASSLLIKLSCNHPTLLLPLFDKLCGSIQVLFKSEECLTQFDKCQLLEAMMTLSNQFCDFDRQSEFLKVIMYPIIQSLTSPAILSGIGSSEVFISFIGIDKPQQTAIVDFPVSKDVSNLMYALNIIRACCKRVSCPTDPEVAKKGNFIHPLSETSGTVFYRNPAAECILPILDKIIQLLKTLNGMCDPVVKLKIDPSHLTVLGISEAEKNSILGLPCPDSTQQQKVQSERIKTYVQNMYEGCLFILANAVENFGTEFYNIPNLPTLLKDSILFKIQYMSAFNLKSFIRLFLRPFFLMCPPSAYDELMRVLEDLCPFMLQKLNSVWEKFKLRYGTSSAYEEQQNETEEILEDQLNRLLTREYIQFLVELLQKQNTKVTNGDSMEDGHPEPNRSKSLTELGLKIISTESVRAVYICTAFDSLRWLDTSANVKALILSETLFHKIMEDRLVKKFQEANYLLQSVLYGVQEHGEHETNLHAMLFFCMQVYLGLSEWFPDLRHTLMTSVAGDERTMHNFENILFKDIPKAKHDKMKKEAFKNVIEKVIGKNVGQHYKKPVLIRNLPPLLSLKPKKDSSLFDVEVNEDIGLCSLFAPTTC